MSLSSVSYVVELKVELILLLRQDSPDAHHFFFFNYLFIYFWLHWVFVGLHGLLIAVASLVAEHGL